MSQKGVPNRPGGQETHRHRQDSSQSDATAADLSMRNSFGSQLLSEVIQAERQRPPSVRELTAAAMICSVRGCKDRQLLAPRRHHDCLAWSRSTCRATLLESKPGTCSMFEALERLSWGTVQGASSRRVNTTRCFNFDPESGRNMKSLLPALRPYTLNDLLL